MNITRGKIPSAKKICVYGVEGVGKSTFASHFPDPVFIDTEESTKELDVARFDKPTSWEMLLQEVRYVIDHPETCKTLIIDTLDWAEKLCIKSVCAKYQKSGLESFDYGRGYTFTYESFGELLNLLSEVTNRGIHVVLTAHATTKRREQPDEFGTYDCWGLKLIDSPKCSIANMVKEYVDILLFVNYKVMVVAADDKGKKHKAQGGKRTMYTTHTPFWDAKNRQGLPEELPLDFSAIAPYLFPEHSKPVDRRAESSRPTDPPPPPAPAGRGDPGAPPPPPQKEAPPPVTRSDADIPAALPPLLESAGVTENEVREVIAKKGYYTMDTPWSVMEESGFVDGWVLVHWEKIVRMITENHDRLPF